MLLIIHISITLSKFPKFAFVKNMEFIFKVGNYSEQIPSS
jgi:hypothetical protein